MKLNEYFTEDFINLEVGVKSKKMLYRGTVSDSLENQDKDEKGIEHWTTNPLVAKTYSTKPKVTLKTGEVVSNKIKGKVVSREFELENALVIEFKYPTEFINCGHIVRHIRKRFREVLKTGEEWTGTYDGILYKIPGNCDGIIFKNIIDTKSGSLPRGWSKTPWKRKEEELKWVSEVWMLPIKSQKPVVMDEEFKVPKAISFTIFLNENFNSDKILVSKGIQRTHKLYKGVRNQERFEHNGPKIVEYWSTKRSVARTYSSQVINKIITLNNAVVIDFQDPVEFNDVGHTLRDIRAKFKEVLKTKIPYKGQLKFLPIPHDVSYEIPVDCDGIIFRNLIDTLSGGWNPKKNGEYISWKQKYLSEVWLIALNTPIQESIKREEELERTEIFKDEVDGIRSLLKKFKERSKGIEDYLQAARSKDREYTKRKSMKDKIDWIHSASETRNLAGEIRILSKEFLEEFLEVYRENKKELTGKLHSQVKLALDKLQEIYPHVLFKKVQEIRSRQKMKRDVDFINNILEDFQGIKRIWDSLENGKKALFKSPNTIKSIISK